MERKFYFTLTISGYDFLPYYQGKVEFIKVTTTEGISVSFPAMHLRKFVTNVGINGFFILITENNKFKSLTKVNS